ncbi:hypothetical protein SSPNP10_34170 [Streptomyces sp. NP10]|uniref:hypothetical protein n=1 Tax=Streptomyces TaxID=1883 RepID=UPI000BF1B42F|nr:MULTISPECIES: hypothetical protein [unclassified Streptomyces]RUP63606.1 hypothetical protein SSPNP10_34170 [Streptomyces sp. NP10]WST57593.1 hypothetical protein OG475_34120 [Streptomyces rubiginosohelvolus]
MTIRVVEDGPSPRILSASGPEAPADGQKIDWVAPTHIGPLSLSQRQLLLTSSYESSSKLGKALLVAAHALQSFGDADRTSQIRASLESDASAASAVAEGWNAKDEAGRLRGNWL